MKIIKVFCLVLFASSVCQLTLAHNLEDENCKLTVQVLGSGGPELSNNRASSSYLLWRNGKAIILIDSGGGSALRFGQSKAKWQDLQAVLFSHFHADHSSDFPALLKASWFGSRTENLDVYGPAGNSVMPSTHGFLDSLFLSNTGAYHYLSDMYDDTNSSEYKIRPHTLASSDKSQLFFDKNGIKIYSQEVEHGPIPALAYVIKACGKVFVFSGDTNSKGLDKLRLNTTDIFIAHHAIPENAGNVAKSLHMTPSQIGKIASRINAKTLVLSHWMNRSLGHEDESLELIKKHFKGTIKLAQDLDIF